MSYFENLLSKERELFKSIRILSCIIVILPICICVSAKTIRVPGDSMSIQSGINGATNGDTVLVADGIYAGSGNYDIFLYGKGILLASENGADNTTIECGFDSFQAHRGFILDNGENTSTRIVGFTIHGAKSDYKNGGAIYCNNSNPIIQNCVISNCYSFYGAALFSRGPKSPILESCTITNNNGNNNNPPIYYYGDGPIFRNCIISQNGSFNPIWGNNQTSQAILDCCYLDSFPKFCDSLSNDYHIRYDSPCHPDSNECGLIGALGVGCLNEAHPYADNIIISPSDSNHHIYSTQPTIHWSYVDTVGSNQTLFLIELCKGSAWIESPEWQSDTLYLSDTTYGYDGPPLISHSTYIMRIKLGNDVGQGPWRYEQFFTRNSNIISIPEAQPNLKYAVNVAFDGDTIIMADGTYSGINNTKINLGTKNISIISENGPLNTIIDGEGKYDILAITGGQDSTTVIDGLTIMNGFLGRGNGFNSAGVTCITTSPIIRNCIFKYNSTDDIGLKGVESPSSAMALINSNAIIENCTFTHNRAPLGGASIFMWGNSDPIINNTIIAFDYGGSGIFPGPDTLILKKLTCTNIYGNTWGDYINGQTDLIGVDGNISADPLFCDVAIDDFHIAGNSPCAPDHPDNNCGVLIGALGVGCGMTDISYDDNILVPCNFHLSQNHPNPFNPTTTIEYTLSTKSHVTVSVYNLLGRKVRTLFDGEKPYGTHTVFWDGKDQNGQTAATGIYFYQIKAGDFVESKKMLLLK